VSYVFRLPDLGEGVAEGEVASWLVEVGEQVAEDAPLLEVQTDKATVEIPSPAAGMVSRILVAAGRVVPVGTPLVVIGEEGESAVEPAREEARTQALPAVRRLAGELGVDLAALAGSGPGGRIVEADVRAAAGGGAGTRVPLTGVRRSIATHLARTQREVPAVTVVEEADFAAVEAVRGERSIVSHLVQAVCAALRTRPRLNATFEGDAIVEHDRIDLGVAVQTEQGLLVPVLRAADARRLDELDGELRRLAEAARAGTLAPGDLRGSTFTITSAGRLGGYFATPLVNVPEVAILGLHRISPRPVVREGEIVVRPIGLVSCTFDHRAVDGAEASAFLLDVIARLERAGAAEDG
jgi:pyruvate/2-oxoglutarate dehydrogenase complex dihydrolipoamide acyltransferase (E2) component